MKFRRLELPDVILIEPQIFGDSRGFFFEIYRDDLFKSHGIKEPFVQDNQSRSQKGVLRGMHYQIPPMAQAKLIRVIRGKIFDVAIDIRKDSPTFGKQVSVILDDVENNMLFVPAGFAHGFLTLEDNTEVLYKVSDFYSPEHERGILWSDPALKVSWPEIDSELILSEKDKKYPPLKNAVLFE